MTVLVSFFFNPHSLYLNVFINHYSYFNFNQIQIAFEFPSAKALINEKHDVDLDTIEIYLKDFSITFVETLKIISLVKALPITTASNERFFHRSKE